MALVKLKSIGFVYIIIAVIVVKVKSVGLQTYCPLGKRICAVSMDFQRQWRVQGIFQGWLFLQGIRRGHGTLFNQANQTGISG